MNILPELKQAYEEWLAEGEPSVAEIHESIKEEKIKNKREFTRKRRDAEERKCLKSYF